MVRKKSCPFKSLLDVDYSDPSIVFWFFGQNVPQTNSQASSLNYNPSFYSNNHILHPNPNNNLNNPASSSKRKSLLVNPKEKEKEKDKKGDKSVKRSRKNEDVVASSATSPSNNNTSINAPTEVEGKNVSLVHPLTGLPDVPILTDLQVYIAEAIITEGPSCPFEKIYEYISKRWKNVRRRDGSNYSTDCRRAIQANLRHSPHHVALFRRDKSKPGLNNWLICNTMDEAIEASKEHEKKDRSKGRNKDVNNEATTEKEEEDEENTTSSPNNTSNIKEESTNGESIPTSNGNQIKPSKSKEIKTENPVKEDSEVEEEINDNEDEKKESKKKTKGSDSDDSVKSEDNTKPEQKLSNLQNMICECINDNGGSCHFDLIVHHVSKNWNKIQSGGTGDCRSSVLVALTDAKKTFKRDTKRTGWWVVSDPNMFMSPVKEEDTQFSTNSRSRSRKSKSTPSSTPITPSTSSSAPSSVITSSPPSTPISSTVDGSSGSNATEEGNPTITSEDDEFTPTSSKNRDSVLTELQILMIGAIDQNKGPATSDQIQKVVEKTFDSLKRRDGTPYTSACKRAIQTSLSSNPSNRPFFKKILKKGMTYWALTPRSEEFLEEHKKKFGDVPLQISNYRNEKSQNGGSNTNLINKDSENEKLESDSDENKEKSTEQSKEKVDSMEIDNNYQSNNQMTYNEDIEEEINDGDDGDGDGDEDEVIENEDGDADGDDELPPKNSKSNTNKKNESTSNPKEKLKKRRFGKI